jgi:hypothetical protein
MREAPRVTVAVVPRETVTQVRDALCELVANTAGPYRLVIVDACYPAATRRWLDDFARNHDALLLRADCAVTPNEARNAALACVDTEFVAFLDDNCFVRSGWLDALVDCADETGAGVVAPLYGFRTSREGEETVHVFAGRAHVEVEDGRRLIDDGHLHCGMPLARGVDELVRTPAETGEFHCLLVRTDVFDEIGPFDEELLCTCEHLDVCMLARERGHEVWFEPAAVAVFERPVPVPWRDRPFYVFRWSRQQNETTLAHFAKKWDLDTDGTVERLGPFVEYSRHLAYHFMHRFPERVLNKLGPHVVETVDRVAERAVVAYQSRRRVKSDGIQVAHSPSWLADVTLPGAGFSSRPAPRRATARTD